MSDPFVLLVYLGGALAWSETHGFWKATIWPYHLGRYLARKALETK